MIPEEIYKRRKSHNNTPPSVLLILTNCIIVAIMVQAFSSCDGFSNFFWYVLAVLAFYNVYTVRRNREEYNRLNIIVYTVSIIGMIALFVYLTSHPRGC